MCALRTTIHTHPYVFSIPNLGTEKLLISALPTLNSWYLLLDKTLAMNNANFHKTDLKKKIQVLRAP